MSLRSWRQPFGLALIATVLVTLLIWRMHLGAIALAAIGVWYSLLGLADELQDWRIARAANGFREALARGHLRNEAIRLALLVMILGLQLHGGRWHAGDQNLPHVVVAAALLMLGSVLDQRQLDWLRRTGGSSRTFHRRRSDVDQAWP